VSDPRAVRRAQLAVATLGLTAVLLVVAIAYDALRYHGLTAEPHMALALLDAVVIARATLSLVRALRRERAFLHRLPVLHEAVVHGHRVRVVRGTSGVFCAGLLQPAVYVAEGTLATSQPAELRAILAHEEHHRARRDPLRLLGARVVADALRPLPPFSSLAHRQAALAELAADAASVAALGSARPLAAALARFDASDEPGVGVAPERVDQLTGLLRTATIPPALFVAAAFALCAIVAAVAGMLLAEWHLDLALPVPLEIAAVVAACVPAAVAARRGAECLQTRA
jgi:Zn-dependent protease with chaperone function